MNIHNSNALYGIILIVLIGLVYLFYSQWKNKITSRIGNIQWAKNIYGNSSNQFFRRQFFLLTIASVFLLFALLDIRKLTFGNDTTTEVKDIVFALDVSNSMNTADVDPDRLEKSKILLQKLINANEGNRMALVIFAGTASILSPLTYDYNALRLNISAIETSSISYQGTSIGKAIEAASACLNPKQLSAKNIVLITDGETHDKDAMSMAENCKKQNVKIFTVGVGTEQGKEILEQGNQPKLDELGNVVVSKLNEKLLDEIASKTNGKYFKLANAEYTGVSLSAEISAQNGAETEDNNFNKYYYYFIWFLGLAFLMLLLEMLLPLFSKKGVSGLNKAALFILFFGIGQNVKAQYKDLLLEGNKNYRQEKYDSSIQHYQRIINQNSTSAEKATAYYNAGNAFLLKGDYNNAISMYKKSLSLNDKQPNAQYNLAYAQKLKKQMENNQEENKEKKENKNNKENKDQNKDNKQDENKEPENEKNQNNKEQSPSKPQKSNLTKQEANRLLDAIKQEEKKILEKKMKGNQSRPVNDKDW